MDFSILGQKVRDTISGFEGVATGVSERFLGGEMVEITGQHLAADGKPVAEWFELARIEIVPDPGV